MSGTNTNPNEFTIRGDNLQEMWPDRPARLRHSLAGHPLFQTERLAEFLGPDSVEWNRADITVETALEDAPRTGLSAADTQSAWRNLRNVEAHPAYCELLESSVEKILSQVGSSHPPQKLEAFIFISSPNAVTPDHMDPEHNVLMQLQGSKTMRIWPADDRSILTDEDLERYHSANQEPGYPKAFEAFAHRAILHPGDAVYVPVTAPHWVQNGPKVSVSFSVTWRSPDSERAAGLHRLNHVLRARGIRPTPVGRSRARDGAKYAVFRAIRRVKGLREASQ
jgi:quercetin dioxygenase-like cupin family protein